MQSQRISAVLIPLRDRNGNVREYTLIEPRDARRVRRHRWYLRSERRYVEAEIGGERTSMAAFIFGEVPAGCVVDHINRWPLDNRRANLRAVSNAENAQNQGSRGGSSIHRGVTWDKSREKWMARVMLNGRGHTVGRFDSETEAAEAAAEFRRQNMPFSQEAA